MAKNLPTFQVTDEQFERLLNVFPDVDAYKAWLKETLISYVTTIEAQTAMQAVRDKQVEEYDLLKEKLFGPDIAEEQNTEPPSV